MNYQGNDSISPPLGFPESKLPTGIFGISPVQPGYYGDVWFDKVVVWTNHNSTLSQLGQLAEDASVTVLALDGGGYSPSAATAFGLIRTTQFQSMLQLAKSTYKGESLVEFWLPQIIAEALSLADNQNLDGFRIRIGDNQISRLIKQSNGLEETSGLPRSPSPAWLRRIAFGSLVAFWQMLLFAAPLFVFGLQTLVFGLVAISLVALTLAAVWNLLPGTGWFRGAICGLVIGLIGAVIVAAVLHWGVLSAISLLLAFLVIGFWLGGAFMGRRPVR